MKWQGIFGALLICTCDLSQRGRADETFLTEAQVPAALFGTGMESQRGVLKLSDHQLLELDHMLGKKIETREYPYLEIFRSGSRSRSEGVVFLLEVIGQNLPILFAVGIRKDGSLQGLEVMVYREPYGREIREGRFRAQFKGKTLKDPLVVNKDIDAISGATLSSQSAAYAARKGLALANLFWQQLAEVHP